MLRGLFVASLTASAAFAEVSACNAAASCNSCTQQNTNPEAEECYWCQTEGRCVSSAAFDYLPMNECRQSIFDVDKCDVDRHRQLSHEATLAPIEVEDETEPPTTRPPTNPPPTTRPPTNPPTNPPPPTKVSGKSCSELGWTSEGGLPDVCAASVINGQCYLASTLAQAVKVCEGAGARLCTSTELEAGEAKGTGCKLDDLRVWSSSTCANGKPVSLSGSIRSIELYPVQCSVGTEFFGVRCCADASGHTSTSSNCASLLWAFSAAGGARGVCAESKILGTCQLSLTHQEAFDRCHAVGARLCTKEELEANVAMGSGCKMDVEQVWSSTSCAGGAIAAGGSTLAGKPSACFAKTSKLAGRCCADVN